MHLVKALNDDEVDIIVEALKKCDKDVFVIWDGGSFGTLFDMGMAYSLGKHIHPVALVEGRSWQQYFKSKIGQILKMK